MSPNSFGSNLQKSVRKFTRHPARIFEILQWTVLFVFLSATLFRLGGDLAYGANMVWSMRLLVLLAMVHGLFMILRHDDLPLQKILFLPLPFLLYALFHQAAITQTPWFGSLELGLYFSGFILFWIFSYAVRTPKDSLILTSIILGAALLALSRAFFEFYFYPEWYPVPEFDRSIEFVGRAAGFFHRPDQLAAILLLTWPFSFLGCWHRRFAGPMRIFLGFVTSAMVIGIILTVSRPAYLAFILQLLALPYFLSEKRKTRIRVWIYTLVGGLVLLFTFWFASTTLREKFEMALSEPQQEYLEVGRAGALSMIEDNLLLGQGIGSFQDKWPRFSPSSAFPQLQHAYNDVLEIGSELGLVGLVLFFIPAGWIFLKSFLLWKRSSFLRLTQSEEALYAKELSMHGHGRRRRKMRFKGGHIPLNNLIPGSFLLGLPACGIALLFSPVLEIPFLFFVLILTLVVLSSLQARNDPSTANRSWLRPFLAVIPLGGSVVLISLYLPSLMAQHFYYLGSEQLERSLETPSAIFETPQLVYEVQGWAQQALQLSPEHADAMRCEAEAILALEHLELIPKRELGRDAAPLLERSLEIHPGQGYAILALAKAYGFQGLPSDRVIPLFEQALELLPVSITVRREFGQYLIKSKLDLKRGEALIEEANQLDRQNLSGL